MKPIARPLSPHLQIYRWEISSVLSDFAPRVRCGVGDERTSIRVVADCSRDQPRGVRDGAWILLRSRETVLFAVTWALFYHLCNGVRHLVWDAGFGFELGTMVRTGWAVVAASIAMTIISFFLAYEWT